MSLLILLLEEQIQHVIVEISEPFMAFRGSLILDFGRDAFGDRIDRPRQCGEVIRKSGKGDPVRHDEAPGRSLQEPPGDCESRKIHCRDIPKGDADGGKFRHEQDKKGPPCRG